MNWTESRLLKQLELGEDSRVEFKEAIFKGKAVKAPDPKDIADRLAALGNTLGGTVIFSVSDDGEIRPMDRDQMDSLETFVGNICVDRIHPPLAFVTDKRVLSGGKSVLLVGVQRSASVHRSPRGYMHRQGSRTQQMSPEALRRLFQKRGRSGLHGPDESLVGETGPGTLDKQLVERFLSSRTVEPVKTQLEKLGLIREDDLEVPRATVAGVLLCSANPGTHIRGAMIEAVRFRGTILGKAGQHDAASIAGPLDKQIRDAVSFAERNTRVAARKDPGRVEIPQFSPRAVFEAVVNAVVHRDYSIEHAKIRLFIFDDRLELYSPGALPNTLSVEAMRNRQVARNETVSSLLRTLTVGRIHGAGDRQYFLETRGEGVPIIYERTQELTGREPVYELLNGTELLLTIPSAQPPVEGIEGVVSVSTASRPLGGVTVVALYPNKTWQEGETDSLGRTKFGFHSDLPITIFCSAPGFSAHVESDWRPPRPLSIELSELRSGGSTVFVEGSGRLPGVAGRLDPVLDNLDRMYLYTTNIAIDGGKQQPVQFKLGQDLRLTDVNGVERMVRFVEMIGRSALLEYRPTHHSP